jgi:[acyl-carrier-protein] S-malonyltransferase
LGLADNIVEEVCASIDGVVVAANYNCQRTVISGETSAVEVACVAMKEAGQTRFVITGGGAFHSPMMEPAREELAAIEATTSRLDLRYIKM